MALLRERIQTRLGIDEAFSFVADFANAERWDPGVSTSVRLDGGPVRVGARYRLGIRMGSRVAPMEYEITHLEAPRRVVLTGRGSGVSAVDDITFRSSGTGTEVHYVADIRLRGVLRLLAPFAGGAFRRIAENARDGMQRALDDLAAAGSTGSPSGSASGSAPASAGSASAA
jgi:carbon monoxide dehydrogenase subunit G